MKKILFRKLLIDYFSFFLIALLGSSIIVWVFQAVNFLDIMIEDGRDYTIYINYSLLNFPKILSRLYPFVLFFSIFHITSKFEYNNELLILWNFGVNKIELINFIFRFSLILMIVQIIFSSLIIPKTQDLARSFLRSSTVNFFGNFIKPQRFNDTIKDVTIYSERKDNEGNLFNLYLKKQIDQNNFQITYAKKGIFKEFNNTPVLVLFDGATITGKNDKITNFSFSKSDFPLNNFNSNSITYKKTQELSSIKLLKCLQLLNSKKKVSEKKIENCSKENLRNIYKELYKRFLIPFYIPLLVLIPFLLILSSKESSNYSKLKIITFLIGLFFIIFSETTVKIISIIYFKNLLISLIPFLLLIFLYLLFFKKTHFKHSN
ncbi:LptF/LptG family permease [Candidatus Pelagibacter bacterium nBUS_33]|uniref:LptF/LptG family permease n=1 Tax=Candidatus Pelagibacter bacterium nBUS_33 TaxID=3374193 RepID=UPI003EBE5E01